MDNIHPAIPSCFNGYIIDSTAKPDLKLSLTAADIDAENAKYPENSAVYNEMMVIFKKLTMLLPEYNTFFLHSAVAELDGDGYIFTGKSGAGKSTHAILWQNHLGAEIINCDKPLFRLLDGEFYAYGNPWAGKEGLHKNNRVRVKAAAFIEQASENDISKMSSAEVLSKLFNQTVYINEPRLNAKLLGLLDEFLLKIPFYRLRCDISKSAAELAYSVMKEDC